MSMHCREVKLEPKFVDTVQVRIVTELNGGCRMSRRAYMRDVQKVGLETYSKWTRRDEKREDGSQVWLVYLIGGIVSHWGREHWEWIKYGTEETTGLISGRFVLEWRWNMQIRWSSGSWTPRSVTEKNGVGWIRVEGQYAEDPQYSNNDLSWRLL